MKTFLRTFALGFLTAVGVARLIVALATHQSVGLSCFWLAVMLACAIYMFVLARRVEKNERILTSSRIEYIELLERQAKTNAAGYRWSSSHARPEQPS